MEPSKEFDELFEEMKEVERSEEAKRNTWLALKGRIATKRKRNIFPAFISLAIVAIATFLIITYSIPSETEQSAESLSNEEIIRAVLEREYNGPDKEHLRLMNDWMKFQSERNAKNQEEYDELLESKEYKDFMNYYQTTFGEYFTENMLTKAISTVMVFKYHYYLEDTDIEMHLENVEIKQEKDHPNIYRPIIEVSLTNSQGQKIFHTLREEFIFSKSEPGKIGSYNVAKGGGSIEFREKIENFNSYVGGNEDVRTPSFRKTISFDTLCFNGKIFENENTQKNIHGCTSDRKKINSILKIFDHLPIKEATEQESRKRAEALPQMDNYQIYLTNEVDKGTTFYTITLYEDGVLMFAPGLDLGILGDITTAPHAVIYEKVKLMLDEFSDN
ncbi:hypothetical protein [Psychrobacillus vulpis]|uniref:Uncharacterized protein n=1 Tax=Psychrobacillus vulpis TaxID=2325572 RepID=A0A544TR98_9BACI|nr:hypothetical protein [Psychrobacillus vulpis]TQR19955.1 hypothetical protein FG384_09850 [Psychrobacillus vulpis]